HRHDHIIIFARRCTMRLFFRNKNLMHLLAGTYACYLRLYWARTDERFGNINDARRRHARYVGLSRIRTVKRSKDCIHSLLKAEKKARHLSGDNGQRPAATYLFM